MKHKVIRIILFLLFSSFAALQYNDPDPYGWMAIYGAVAVTFLLSILGRGHGSIFKGVAVLVFTLSLFYIPGFITYLSSPNKEALFGEMIYDRPYIEETREFLGLIICGMALLYLIKTNK